MIIMRALKSTYFILISFVFLLLVACVSNNKERFAEFNNQTEAHIFQVGERALVKGDYSEAIKNFEALEAQYPFGPHSEQAKLESVYLYYQLEDFPTALAVAMRFIQLYPSNQRIDYVYYMKGIIEFETGWSWTQRRFPYNRAQHELTFFQEAFDSFHSLIEKFPKSLYVRDAQQHMVYIRNTLAQNELEIAEFYLKKKAYPAAKARALIVITRYQGAPQVTRALEIFKKTNA